MVPGSTDPRHRGPRLGPPRRERDDRRRLGDRVREGRRRVRQREHDPDDRTRTASGSSTTRSCCCSTPATSRSPWTLPGPQWGRRWTVDLDTSDQRTGVRRKVAAKPGDVVSIYSLIRCASCVPHNCRPVARRAQGEQRGTPSSGHRARRRGHLRGRRSGDPRRRRGSRLSSRRGARRRPRTTPQRRRCSPPHRPDTTGDGVGRADRRRTDRRRNGAPVSPSARTEWIFRADSPWDVTRSASKRAATSPSRSWWSLRTSCRDSILPSGRRVSLRRPTPCGSTAILCRRSHTSLASHGRQPISAST